MLVYFQGLLAPVFILALTGVNILVSSTSAPWLQAIYHINIFACQK